MKFSPGEIVQLRSRGRVVGESVMPQPVIIGGPGPTDDSTVCFVLVGNCGRERRVFADIDLEAACDEVKQLFYDGQTPDMFVV